MSINLWRPIDAIGCHLIGPSFVGGRSIEEVLRTGEELKKGGYGVTYNLLGERLESKNQVAQTFRTISDLIEAMTPANSGNVSLKPTQAGLAISFDLFLDTAEHVVEHARTKGVETEFDAEEWEFIPDTCKGFSILASKPNLREFMRLAVQAHLAQIHSLMDEYNLWQANLRIVQGSGVYPESSGIAIKDRKVVLGQYFGIAERNLQEGQVPYLATMRNRTILDRARPDIPIQMLYGPIGREIGEKLLQNGRTVRMYIPYVVDWCKNAWKPYGMRRAATVRRLFFEDKEVRRVILREIKNRLFPVAKK